MTKLVFLRISASCPIYLIISQLFSISHLRILRKSVAKSWHICLHISANVNHKSSHLLRRWQRLCSLSTVASSAGEGDWRGDATLVELVDRVKGGVRAPPPLTGWTGFTIMLECMPESGYCRSMYSHVCGTTDIFTFNSHHLVCLSSWSLLINGVRDS